ncbi:MAG: S24 family peptidase [Bacillota bacterium]
MGKGIFGIWLQEKRAKAGYESQGALSRACGIDHSTVARWERGDVKPMPENLKKLAPFLGVSFEELMAAVGYISDVQKPDAGPDYSPTRKAVEQPDRLKEETGAPYRLPALGSRIPLLVAVTPGTTDVEPAGGYIEVPSGIQADFAVRVAGNNMSRAGVADGDIAICRNASPAELRSGRIVAASLKEMNWGITVRFYVEQDGRKLLRAANPGNKDVTVDGDAHRIAGVVVKFLKDPPALDRYRRLTDAHSESPEWASLIALTKSAGLTPHDLAQYVETVRKASLKAGR